MTFKSSLTPTMQTMLAIDIQHPGGPEVLVPALHPVPQPGSACILVKVEAAGVNRPDVLQRRGLYPPPPGASEIPGLEIAGEVVALGTKTSRFNMGDKGCGLVAGGGYAEYCVVHESNALPVPRGLSMAEAAAVPETFFTVWANLFQRGKLRMGRLC
jgi:NADPH:quinone reductase-like Zn-dependent oxidoreductase